VTAALVAPVKRFVGGATAALVAPVKRFVAE
jgi:hypothetical protein